MRRIAGLLLLALLAGCHRSEQPAGPDNGSATSADAPDGSGKGVDKSHRDAPAPDADFIDPSGEEVTLADFKGKPVLVNLWATWCAPCVKELPTLDKMATERPDLQVIAVSQDNGPQPSVVAFLKKTGVSRLGAYQDPGMKLSGAVNAQILPTTILYDSNGHEIWRYIGDLDWTGPEAAKLLAETDPQGG